MFELIALHECDPKRIAHFLTLNRARFRPYAPTRSDHYYTSAHWRAACRQARLDWREGRAYRFVITHKNADVIGKIDLDHIRRGPFGTGELGYLLDARHEGQSIMRRALGDVLSMAFTNFGLNRVQAAIMPHNMRSRALVTRLGFREIGLAKHYLKLDGDWRDHLLFERVAGLNFDAEELIGTSERAEERSAETFSLERTDQEAW